MAFRRQSQPGLLPSPYAPTTGSPAQRPSPSTSTVFINPFDVARCLRLLQEYDASMVSNRQRLTPLERRRLQNLTEAAQEGDIFFMMLHILCCRRFAVEQNLLLHPVEPELFDVVDRIQGPSAILSPQFLAFAVSFPMPYTALHNHNPGILARVVSDIRDCLLDMTRLIPDYEELGRSTKLLPLPHDLINYCKMQSPCLQRVVFGYLLRQSWMHIGDNRAALQAMNRFLDLQRMTGPVYPNGYPPELAANEYKFFQECYVRANPERASDLPTLFGYAEGIIKGTTLFTPTRLHQSEAPAKPTLTPRHLPPHPTQPRHQLSIHSSSRQQILPTRNNILMAAPPAPSPAKVKADVKRSYRYVAGFKIIPEPLKATPARQHFKFDLSQDELDRRALQSDGQKTPDHNNLSFRLRCCAIASAKNMPDASDWTVKEAAFPPYVYYSLNGKSLIYPQKDLHYKYSPIDVTDLVQVGSNTLSLSINRRSDEEQDLKHGIAIEVVTHCNEEQARATCLSNPPLTYEEVVTSIKRALQVSTPEDDLVLVNPTLTITITEPFSSSEIFKIPVKGLHCTHRQPFDLDVYLHTRPESQFVAGYSKTDAWKCPICGGDARPICLVKDEFMVAVRADLDKRGMLNTRAIIVDNDGSWKPKVEIETPEGGRAVDEVMSDQTKTVRVPEREIIEID